ncbi:MAG: PD40 domain-containing protein [Victivallales bacterium]|nr:PD40 domain-containing protein [Victivallales bacterium]
MRSFQTLFITAFIFLAAALFGQHTITSSVVKVGSGNPSLGIASFTGDEGARAVLLTVLQRCDWFSVLKDASGAQVKLSVRYDAAPEHAFTGQLTYGGNSKSLTAYGADGDLNQAACIFVDDILKKLWNVPALCSRPIAYVRNGNKGMKELFTCRIDGSGTKRITHNNAISTEPSWGHAGALVYTLNNTVALNIVLMDIANQRQRIVSSARGLNASPSLSRDGRTLLLPLSFGKQVDLYEIDLSTGKRTRITNDRDVESSPCFSPDGQEICFVSDRSGRPQLYRMRRGGKAQRLQLGGGEAVSPDWSAFSNKLCYATRNSAGQYVVAVLDMADPDAAPMVVTQAAGNWEAPSWAPDGRHIVCTRKTGHKQELYIVDSWLRTFQQLSSGTGYSLPAWCPAR